MDQFLHFAGDYWWLIFPVGGVVGGWFGSLARYNDKRRRDKIELVRVKASAQKSPLCDYYCNPRQRLTDGAKKIARAREDWGLARSR